MFKLIFEWAKDWIDEKLKSPFWWSIILTWLTWNWEIWYITIFVSENEIWNKLLYIKNMYNYYNINFYWLNIHPCLWFLINWIIMPLFLSWLIIWIITPKISHKFLKKHTINKENEIEIINLNTKLINAETKNIEAEKNKLNAELEKQKLQFEKEMEDKTIEMRKKAQEYAEKKANEENRKKELELMKQQELMKKTIDELKERAEKWNQETHWDTQINWDNEYNLLTIKYPNLISDLDKLIYKYKWQINSDTWTRQINEDIEKILDSNWIINYTNKEMYDWRVYEITEKWKYFLKKSTLK